MTKEEDPAIFSALSGAATLGWTYHPTLGDVGVALVSPIALQISRGGVMGPLAANVFILTGASLGILTLIIAFVMYWRTDLTRWLVWPVLILAIVAWVILGADFIFSFVLAAIATFIALANAMRGSRSVSPAP